MLEPHSCFHQVICCENSNLLFIFFPAAKKYVDVLNPTGQSSSNGPVMLPNSLLPTFPGPTAAINPATLFVPTPVTGMKDLLLRSLVF